MLKTLTFTGADDKTNIQSMLNLSEEFPFIEWGILMSKNNFGSDRYPSMEWINKLCADVWSWNARSKQEINLSLHVCGGYVREFLRSGSTEFIAVQGSNWYQFNRIQLNTGGFSHDYSDAFIEVLKRYPEKQFIFQLDGENILHEYVKENGVTNIAGLFDTSGGRGILPMREDPTDLTKTRWRKPIPDLYCGYAGGLKADILAPVLTEIIDQYGPTFDFWADLESHVRTDTYEDAPKSAYTARISEFDLEKVRACCLQVLPFLKK